MTEETTQGSTRATDAAIPSHTNSSRRTRIQKRPLAAIRVRAKGFPRAVLEPEMLVDYTMVAGFHIESGHRKFVDFAQAIVADLGNAVRPYLRSLYESVRYYPGFNSAGMSSHAEADEAFRTLGNMPTATSSKAANAPGSKGSVLRLVINRPARPKLIKKGDQTSIEWPKEIVAVMPPSMPTPIPPHQQ